MTRKKFRRAYESFLAATRDRDRFRRTCVEFFEIERRKPIRLQEWVLWAILREVAFDAGLVHIWQNAHDHVDLMLDADHDADFRDHKRLPCAASDRNFKNKMKGAIRDNLSRRPAEMLREYERIALIRERHQAIKARRRGPAS